MASNKSAFLDAIGKPLRIAESPMPKPGANDIIVKNHAVAINTVDPSQADTGFMVKQYPIVLGSDVAGEVTEVGSSVTRFKKGDRVVGHAWVFQTGQPEDGAFSLYCRVPAGNAAIIPSNIEYKQAAILPMAIDTASVGLHKEGYLGIDYPSVDAKPNGKVLVVYGGSSSVGAAAIQLAVNAGCRVIATSSPKNFDLCLECGASDVFDYKDPDVAEKIAKAVGKENFVGLWNAIGIPESFEVVIPIMQKLGGGFVANTKPPGELPKDIEARFVLGIDKATWLVWESGFLTKALESGKLKCLPEPMVVGKGLESLQQAFAVRKGDISAQKVVVEL
jgi:NADPH:quinone reductase-like Zn-dependent oxidoreductase